jgi:hypothetical protein
MSNRKEPIRKSPGEILADLLSGHDDARVGGSVKAMKYLQNVIERMM